METRLKVSPATMAGPEVSFGLDDQVKWIAVGLSGTQIGFLSTVTFTFLGTPVNVTTTAFHVYELRKFAADSVQLRMDGARIASRAYSAFPTRISGSAHGFYFGPLGTGTSALSVAGNSSSWDYVIFEIGAIQP
jgi:hypothetical protein